MSRLDGRLLTLLPALGLCSCVTASEGGPERAQAPRATSSMDHGGQAPRWRDAKPGREPMSLRDAAVQAARESLLEGHYEAANELYVYAARFEEGIDEITLGRADAKIGLGDYSLARELLDDLDGSYPEEAARREVRIRELEHDSGPLPCEVTIEREVRPLVHGEGFLAAWNELRGGLQSADAAEIPIVDHDEDAEYLMCESRGQDCFVDEPTVVRLEGEGEAVTGLVIAHEDDSVTVIPELLHTTWDSCEDDSAVSMERRGNLLHVRAFADLRDDEVEPSKWALIQQVSDKLESTAAATVAAASTTVVASTSSSYAYAYASSGYPGSGTYAGYSYSYSYSYSYGCSSGYYDYGYDYEGYVFCEDAGFIERDLFIDLARGEIVLDITRTGGLDTALGTVHVDPGSGAVEVAACGVEDTLELSWTRA